MAIRAIILVMIALLNLPATRALHEIAMPSSGEEDGQHQVDPGNHATSQDNNNARVLAPIPLPRKSLGYLDECRPGEHYGALYWQSTFPGFLVTNTIVAEIHNRLGLESGGINAAPLYLGSCGRGYVCLRIFHEGQVYYATEYVKGGFWVFAPPSARKLKFKQKHHMLSAGGGKYFSSTINDACESKALKAILAASRARALKVTQAVFLHEVPL